MVDVGGVRTTLNPEGDPADLAPALLLVRTRAERAVVAADGQLELRFATGVTIVVPPDERYEAWTLAGSDGPKVVSMPGGELAIWGPR